LWVHQSANGGTSWADIKLDVLKVSELGWLRDREASDGVCKRDNVIDVKCFDFPADELAYI
jgi:hypothetical protein